MTRDEAMLLFYAIVFAAIALVVVGLYRLLQDQRGSDTRIAKRMRALAADSTGDAARATLRRDAGRRGPAWIPIPLWAFLTRQLGQAGMTTRPERFLMKMVGATAAIAIGFPVLGGILGRFRSPAAILLVLVFALAVGVALPLALVARRGASRIGKFEAQFPTALDIFVRGLRAGHPVQSALILLVEESPEPIRTEFRTVIDEMNYGYDLRRALSNLAERVSTPDMQMFVVSVSIQADTGGNLADILDGLARVIRERASMVLKVRALSSEGKITGMMLSLLPVATFCFLFAVQPKFYLDVLDDRWFMPGVAIMFAMYATGVVVMKSMIKIKV